MQSAVRTPTNKRGRFVQTASASGRAPLHARSARTQRLECTCFSIAVSAGAAPNLLQISPSLGQSRKSPVERVENPWINQSQSAQPLTRRTPSSSGLSILGYSPSSLAGFDFDIWSTSPRVKPACNS